MGRASRTILWVGAQLAVLAIASLPLWLTWSVPEDVRTLSTTMPSNDMSRATTLPDDWRAQNYAGDNAVYEFVFVLDQAPEEPWALLVPSVRMNIDVSVNGHSLVHDETDARQQDSRMWYRPLHYAMPTGVLHAGTNTARIELLAPAGRGYLAAPLVGRHVSLAPLTRLHQFWRPVLLQIIVVSMAAVSILMLILWARRRTQSIYGLYAVGMLSWAAHDLNYMLVNPPLPSRYWDALSVALLGGFIAAAMCFIHRYIDEHRPRTERALFLFIAVAVPLLFLLPETAFQSFSDFVWHPVVMSFGCYLYLLLYVEAWRRSSAELHLLAMTGSVMVLYGTHDVLVSSGMLTWDFGYLLPYSAAPSLVVFSSLLVNHFARDQIKLEAITRDLDRRVQEATLEIERNHARLRDLEQERVLTVERERVARDIHDGVGGQLVALLARIKSGRQSAEVTEAAISHAMHDLRLVIQSLDVADGDLGTALASWRHGLERRLAGSGLHLVWKPSDVPRLPDTGPSDILNVLRLLDEAATNVLRHARASRITIEYGMSDGRFFVCLADNGTGGAQSTALGNGLKNMQRRAQTLGADLEIDSSENGTRVRLQLRDSRDQASNSTGTSGRSLKHFKRSTD